MSEKKLGKQTVIMKNPPSVLAGACVVGPKEGQGPLKHTFDVINEDDYFGEKSWEKAESAMTRQAFSLACDKAAINPSSLDYIFAGDLLNQCVASSYAMRESGVPYFGVFGACSTMAETLSLAAMAIDGGFADTCAAAASSHFCTAERQFRNPLEYGGQRAPTAQWTVTGSGVVILGNGGDGPYITHVTTGKIIDAGVTDAANMGAAMAPAAYETIKTHLSDTGLCFGDYDAVLTGDLGKIGSEIVRDLFLADGIELGPRYMDCGMLIFSSKSQDTHSGGSGCGCAASVLCGHLLGGMRDGQWKRLLLCATGALMSPTMSMQGESIPGICHCVSFSVNA